MMLCNNVRLLAHHKQSAHRKSPDALPLRNTGFLQQMQTPAPAADKDEFRRMARSGTVVEIPHLQVPGAVAGTFNIIDIMLESDIRVVAL
ncbi:hypothetical protein D3C73_888880 [compost metagenome]